MSLTSPRVVERHFLRYWKPEAVDITIVHGGKFGHSAGNQHERNRKGDTLWLVTVRHGDLQLVGRMVVWKVMSLDEVVSHFGHDEFWEADFHVVAKRGTEEAFAQVSITALADRLRFVSPTGRDRLLVVGGKVPAQQLQSMRQLTDESVGLLREVWDSRRRDASNFMTLKTTPARRGGGFGDSETNRAVEQAAEEAVADFYRGGGWSVQHVGKEGGGYELRCVRRDGAEHHVEVKGISGDAERFVIYRSGLRHAADNPSYRLFTVLNALNAKCRQLNCYTGAELLQNFGFEPKDYFAVKKE